MFVIKMPKGYVKVKEEDIEVIRDFADNTKRLELYFEECGYKYLDKGDLFNE